MDKLRQFIGCRTVDRREVFLGGDGDLLGYLQHPRFGPDSQEMFEWGYGGAGPRHLAFAILYAVCRDLTTAMALEQRYKWDVVANLPKAFWQISSLSVEGWLVEQIAKMPPPEDDDVLDLGDHGRDQ